LAIESGEEYWSVFSGALGRKLLRLDEYLKDAPSGVAQEEEKH